MGLKHSALLRAFTAGAAAIGMAGAAVAAPDRLDDKVPDAVPDTPGAFAISLGHEWLDMDGALVSQTTNHNMFKVRYQFNPKVSGSIGYQHHDLAGAEGLLSPLFNQQDSATVWNFDLAMNLLNTPREAAAPGKEFVPGSAFTIGVGGDFYDTSAGAVSDSTTLLKAYLMYSTDLSEELRAHTYFSSGRLSGGGRSGSVNTIGAGLDYELAGGEHPLTLMANGVMDIYNFRDPAFNTSRVTRFDLGLRYKMSQGLYGNLGWMTVNDSENDASGSGIFAGLNWAEEKEECVVCDEVLENEQTSPAPAPSASSSDRLVADSAPMMDSSAPALDYPGEAGQAGLRGTEALITANAEQNNARNEPGNRSTPPLPLYDTGSADKTAASIEPAAAHEPVALSEPGHEPPQPEQTSARTVVLDPGRNVPLAPQIKAETLDKVYGARESVDSHKADYGIEETAAPVVIDEPVNAPAADTEDSQLEPVTLPAELLAAGTHAAETPFVDAEPALETAAPSEPVSSVVPETGVERQTKYNRSSRFDFPAATEASGGAAAPVLEDDAARLIQLEDQADSGLQPTGADQTAKPTAPEAPAEGAPPASSSSPRAAASVPPGNGNPDSTDVLLAQIPNTGGSRETEHAAAIPTQVPSARDIAPVPLPADFSASQNVSAPAESGGRRHIQAGDIMQRPPVSETARSGMNLLMSFMLPVRDTPAQEQSEEIPAGETVKLDELPVEQNPTEPELLVPSGSGD